MAGRVWLIHGYLGVGKTTLARELAERTGAIRFSVDVWMVSLYGNDPDAGVFNDCYLRTQALVDGVWTEVVRRGIDVVLDFGFWGEEFRAQKLQEIQEAGGDVRWIKLYCEAEVALGRIKARNSELVGSLFVAEETYRDLIGRFEELDDEDCDFVFDTGVTGVEEMIERIVANRA